MCLQAIGYTVLVMSGFSGYPGSHEACIFNKNKISKGLKKVWSAKFSSVTE